MVFLSIMAAVIAVTMYVSLVFKLSFMVFDWTERTGFEAGFYFLVLAAGFALPYALFAEFFV